MNTNHLYNACHNLKLDILPKLIEAQLSDPAYEKVAFDLRLLELLDGQAAINRERKIARLQRLADLRYPNAFIEDMKYELYPALKVSQFEHLCSCNWVEQKQNVPQMVQQGSVKPI